LTNFRNPQDGSNTLRVQVSEVTQSGTFLRLNDKNFGCFYHAAFDMSRRYGKPRRITEPF
jgi:hypothetical protein